MQHSAPWGDLCAAASGLVLWGCHIWAWAMPVVSTIALLLSIGVSAFALWRMLHGDRF